MREFNFEKIINLFPLKIAFAVCFCVLVLISHWILKVSAQEDLKITADFESKTISDTERIVLKLNRQLLPDGENISVVVNNTDITALFNFEDNSLVYVPTIFLFPEGKNHLKIYRTHDGNNWKELEDFSFQIKKSASREKINKSSNKTNIAFTPQVSVNMKGENTFLFFPNSSAPEREHFTDTGGQASLNLTVSRAGWNLNNQFDLAGTTRRNETLRFGELGGKAPAIDLSSYLIQLEKGRFKAGIGHISFGSSRHLIDSFSSRGVNVTVPLTKRDEISFGAANGTSVVGFGNFIGITRAKHSVIGITYGREIFRERGALRFEATFMRGSLLPITNVNQGGIVDAEKSFGGTFRLKRDEGRLRFDGGFTRSHFTNPSDQLLEQSLNVGEVRPVTRNAKYAEVSYDIFKDLKLIKGRDLRLSATYRFEELQPLFRSTAASNQADRRKHQFEFTGNLGDINFTFGNLRDRDNLRNIDSILKTLNFNNNVSINFSLGTIFNLEKPSRFLPQIGYTFTTIHQFGAFLPSRGDFRELSQVPDQFTSNHNFGANWKISEKLDLSYQFQKSFIDNRQTGREIADAKNITHSINLDYRLFTNFSFSTNMSWNDAAVFENQRTDKTFNLGSGISWQNAFIKNSAFTASFSGTVAGDDKNTSDNRSGNLSLEWSYKRAFGEKKFKKIESQFFIRYNNTYGDTRDNIFFVNNFNKRQTFNFGLTFNIF